MIKKIIVSIKEGTIVERVKFKFEYKIFRPFIKLIVRLFPIQKNKIVFSNFSGKGYSDNPKYIAEKLIKKYPNLHYVWLVSNMSLSMPKQIKKVKQGSIRAYYEWATAKIWVDNIRNTDRPKKKKHQVYLQTWHGPYSLKKIEGDAEENLNLLYIEKVKYDAGITDAILAGGYLQELQFKRAFYLSDKTEILKYGLPRNDALFIPSQSNDLRNKYGFSESDFLILYAPTFRDDGSKEGYKLDFLNVINAFSALTKVKCKLIIRLHPNVDVEEVNINYDNIIIFNGNIIEDMQELAVMCDTIISDYSSTIFDFAALKKPFFLFCNDLPEYEAERGLMPEFYQLPFPCAHNNEELIDNILNFNISVFREKLNEFYEKSPNYDDGNASEKVADWIYNKLN